MVDPNETPTEAVLKMKTSGTSDNDISDQLTQQGYSQTQVSEAMNQAQIKSGVEAPPPPSADMQPSMLNEEAPPPTGEYPTPEQVPEETMLPAQEPQYPQEQYYGPTRSTEEAIEEIAEAIIDERWQQILGRIGDIATWKEKNEADVESIKQEVIRIEQRFDSLQKALVERIGEYDGSIKDVSTEIKALEKVLQKIIEPLVKNVKELSKITAALKKK